MTTDLRTIRTAVITIFVVMAVPVFGQSYRTSFKQTMRRTDATFFQTPEARRIGDQLLLFQRVTGGWPKNIDMARALSDEEKEQILGDRQKRNDSTTDNAATTLQMDFLARLYQATHDKRYRDAFRRAVDYLLSGQYENGGWPQFWPEMRDYQIHITYNDNAMVHTLRMLRDMAARQEPYQGDLTEAKQRRRMTAAFDNGIECILATQIKTNGRLTVWCQQHDRETLLPAAARAYELPSYCSMESAGIIELLMELPAPDDRVKRAIIWHDGRGDKSRKLVIKDSYFDALSPTPLGRYHHDSQFFLLNCKLSKNILDQNIRYAYTDKVLDPCPWGLRVYYYNCLREGGHSGWLKNNLQESEEHPEFHGVTADWTFQGLWHPEARIKELWNVLAY